MGIAKVRPRVKKRLRKKIKKRQRNTFSYIMGERYKIDRKRENIYI